MAEKTSFTVQFAVELVGGGMLTIPVFLLKNYVQLGLSEKELAVIIHIQQWQNAGEPYPSVDQLKANMSMDTQEIKQILALLMEKKCLEVVRETETGTTGYSLHGLYDQLAEIWACAKAMAIQQAAQANQNNTTRSKEFHITCSAFEGEFGRPLSPYETQAIADWIDQDQWSPQLIAEALKRAVMRGVLNMKYIDTILRDWAKNGVRTPEHAKEYEERFQTLKAGKGTVRRKSKKANSQDNYDDAFIS